MEKRKSTHRQDKNKAQPRVSGGGMESVIVWGGALAIAGLIAAFTIKKSRGIRDDNGGYKKQDERSQGPSSILQPTVNHNECCASYGSSKLGVIQNGSRELVFYQSLVLKKEPVPIIYGRSEDSTNGNLILPSDCSEESIASSDEVPVGRSSYKPRNMIKNGHREDSLMETIGAEGENEAEDAEQVAVEETSQMQLAVEEEVGGDDNDDDEEGEAEDEDDEEKGEESSEGTRSLSMESNVEAIWPAEIIEALPPESKEVNYFQNSGEKIEGEDGTAEAKEYSYLVNNKSGNIFGEDGDNNKTTVNSMMVLNEKENQELVMVNEQTARSPQWKIRNWPLLVLVLLLLLVLHVHCIVF